MTHDWSAEEVKSFKLLLKKILENLHHEEDFKEGRVVAKLLTDLGPEDAEAWYFLGVLNGALGAYDDAKNSLLRSLELGGEKFQNYAQLAQICRMAGRVGPRQLFEMLKE